MTSNQPNPSNPVFKTPQPNQLQSEQDREAIRQTLSKEQDLETDSIDKRTRQDDASANAVDIVETMDNLTDRHIPIIDTPPG